MDLTTTINNINWLLIFFAGFSAFMVGGIWYGPLFGKTWMKVFDITPAALNKQNKAKVFGLSAILSLIAAFSLSMFIGPNASMFFGAIAGFLAGLTWVSTMLGILYLFEMRPLKAFLINAGYCTLALTIMGLILGIGH